MTDPLKIRDVGNSRKPKPLGFVVGDRDDQLREDREQSRVLGRQRRAREKADADQLEASVRMQADVLSDQSEENFSVEAIEVTREEVIEEITQGARAYLDMTFEEFRAAYRKGALPDTLAANELIITLRFAGLTREV